jgi:hypothetical protein
MLSLSVSRLLLGAAGALALASVFSPARAQAIGPFVVSIDDGIEIRLSRVLPTGNLNDLDRDEELATVCGLVEAAGAAGIDVADAATLASVLEGHFDVEVDDEEPVYYYDWDDEQKDWVIVCWSPATVIVEPQAPNPIQIVIGERIALP